MFHAYTTNETNKPLLRVSTIITMKQLKRMIDQGRVSIAPFNRPEVKTRKGSAAEYASSTRTNVSLGQFLGYTEMPYTSVLKTIKEHPHSIETLFTKEFPLSVSEGGHRTRWTAECEESDAPIALSFLACDDNEHLMSTVRKEFEIVNNNVCPLKAGEIVNAFVMDNERSTCVEMLKTLVQRHCPKTKNDRCHRVAIANAVVNTVCSRDFSKLHQKHSAIEDTKHITPSTADTDTIRRVVDSLGRVLTHVEECTPKDLPKPAELEAAERALKQAKGREAKEAAENTLRGLKYNFKDECEEAKKMHKLTSSLRFDLDLFGPLLYGLLNAESQEIAVSSINRWFDVCIRSQESWERCMSSVTTSTTSTRYYDENRFKSGWTKIVDLTTA